MPCAPRTRRSAPLVALLLLAAAGAAAASAQGGSATDRSPAMASTSSRPEKADADTLVGLFPAALGAWQQAQLERPLPPQVPGPQSAVRAAYTMGTHRAQIDVMLGKPDRSAPGTKSVYKEGPAAGGPSMVSVSFANGVTIGATSATADAAALEALLRSIDLARVERLQPVRR